MKLQHLRNIKLKQKGFTLVEVLVVIGILAIMLAVTLVAINPGQHFQDSRNSQRQANVTAILDAIYEYQSGHNGNIPPSLAGLSTTKTIAKSSPLDADEVDLCADLVPDAIADMPFDPSNSGTIATVGDSCSDTAYNTGYQITKNSSNRFTVSAPNAEGTGVSISVTR
jgi:prepilin-type N-terminal cleavage/methylation domain-containing protein